MQSRYNFCFQQTAAPRRIRGKVDSKDLASTQSYTRSAAVIARELRCDRGRVRRRYALQLGAVPADTIDAHRMTKYGSFRGATSSVTHVEFCDARAIPARAACEREARRT